MANEVLRHQPETNRLDAEYHLRDILADVVDINMMLRKSKADFVVVFNDANHEKLSKFDPTLMKLRDVFGIPPNQGTPASRSVDLIISPILIKRGTSDGDIYDVETVLVKADVICDINAGIAQGEDCDDISISRAGISLKQERDIDEEVMIVLPPIPKKETLGVPDSTPSSRGIMEQKR